MVSVTHELLYMSIRCMVGIVITFRILIAQYQHYDLSSYSDQTNGLVTLGSI